MHRHFEDVTHLSALATLNGVDFNNNAVSIQDITGSGKNSGIVAQRNLNRSATGPQTVLMTVPQSLVLSLENVWIYSKADRHLREVLEAVGEYARVRGYTGAPQHLDEHTRHYHDTLQGDGKQESLMFSDR